MKPASLRCFWLCELAVWGAIGEDTGATGRLFALEEGGDLGGGAGFQVGIP
jgi:hypothetical protein